MQLATDTTNNVYKLIGIGRHKLLVFRDWYNAGITASDVYEALGDDDLRLEYFDYVKRQVANGNYRTGYKMGVV